jgi:hypothetical protein
MALQQTFWSEERNLSSMLAILVGYHLVLPLGVELGLGGVPAAICVSLLAVSGVLTSYDNPYLRVGVRVIAAAAVFAAWHESDRPTPLSMLPATIVDATLVAFLASAVAAQVFRSGPVTAHRVRGAIALYLLIGVFFGLLFEGILLYEPEAIRLSIEMNLAELSTLRREVNYFSFVTLTTVGYGDVTPVSPMARALATLEAICGQLYLTITLARLVSNLRNTTED